jgi:hypothetical protein
MHAYGHLDDVVREEDTELLLLHRLRDVGEHIRPCPDDVGALVLAEAHRHDVALDERDAERLTDLDSSEEMEAT